MKGCIRRRRARTSRSAIADLEDEGGDASRPAVAGLDGDSDHGYGDGDSDDDHWRPSGHPDDSGDDAELPLGKGNTWRLNFTMRKIYVSSATAVFDFLVDLLCNASMVLIIFLDPDCNEDLPIMRCLMALARVSAMSEVSDKHVDASTFTEVMDEAPNKSVLDMLNTIQFAKTPYQGSAISNNKTFTTQVLPRCFLHTKTGTSSNTKSWVI